MCDKNHANKHQVKEDQTHVPLPPIITHYQGLQITREFGDNASLQIKSRSIHLKNQDP